MLQLTESKRDTASGPNERKFCFARLNLNSLKLKGDNLLNSRRHSIDTCFLLVEQESGADGAGHDRVRQSHCHALHAESALDPTTHRVLPVLESQGAED